MKKVKLTLALLLLTGAGCTYLLSASEEFELKEKCSKLDVPNLENKGYGIEATSVCYSGLRNSCVGFQMWYTENEKEWGYTGRDLLTNEKIIDSTWFGSRKEAGEAFENHKNQLSCL